MKALFEFIKARIESRVPEIKTVRMWNNQLIESNITRKEKPFKYPACFIEFIVNEVHNRSMGIKDYILTVRFRFARESYKFERLETFDFCDDFSAAIQLMAPTLASGLTFTTFQETISEFDEDFNNVEAPYMDFRTQYRSLAAYNRGSDVLHGPIDPDADGLIVEHNEL